MFFKSNCYKNTNLKKRWYFARELKKSGLSLKMARQYGYPISKRLWPNCNNDVERNKGKINKLNLNPFTTSN